MGGTKNAPAAKTERDLGQALDREWLVTNGLGGYASGTVSGPLTRRYHGLLIAALAAPLGRTVMLSQVTGMIRHVDGRVISLATHTSGGGDREQDNIELEFALENGLPVWRYFGPGFAIEKRLVMPHRQNTVYLHYRLVKGNGPVLLSLRPEMNFRQQEDAVSTPLQSEYAIRSIEHRHEVFVEKSQFPPLRMTLLGAERAFTFDWQQVSSLEYAMEAARGYDSRGDLWAAGHFSAKLTVDEPVTLIATCEPWETALALSPSDTFDAELGRRRELVLKAAPSAQQGTAAELVLAADQFLIVPRGRQENAVRARAAGDELRTVIAGYHWFTDWGRDTMISLEGLTLTTGRHEEAASILQTFAFYIRDGLIPNMFPEGKNDGLYNTADATLWFFHAVQRYVQVTGDRAILDHLVPKFENIVQHHLRGTRFGIHLDPQDSLLAQGAQGYQLTWMDAKIGEWVVTPRRGKAVEINALWYNALRLLQQWHAERNEHQKAAAMGTHADRTYESFNRRFWYEAGGYLFDVVDAENGDDRACRPNQVFAISLDHPVLEPLKWQRTMDVVEQELLTPVGLRSLSPSHPDYKCQFFGDLHARDAAYHQGTVWAWLIGPFIDAWLKVHHNNVDHARKFLRAFDRELRASCVGQISEVFDAEEPFTPRGCIAQAWSVAEVLRCWSKVSGL